MGFVNRRNSLLLHDCSLGFRSGCRAWGNVLARIVRDNGGGGYTYALLSVTYHWAPLLAALVGVLSATIIAFTSATLLVRLRGDLFALGSFGLHRVAQDWRSTQSRSARVPAAYLAFLRFFIMGREPWLLWGSGLRACWWFFGFTYA